MQIVSNGGFMPGVAETLVKMCEEQSFPNKDLIIDVYIVCEAQGRQTFVPDDQILKDLERTDPAYWAVKADAAKRKAFIERMADSNYMKALISLNDPMKAVLTFIDHMKKAQQAKINATKGTKPIDISGNSDDPTSGARDDFAYASEDSLNDVRDRRKNTVDDAPDFAFDDLLHEEGGSYADVVADDGLSSFFSGCGSGNRYSHTEIPGMQLASSVVRYGMNLPNNYPLLFDWYTKILEDLGVQKIKQVDTDDQSAKARKDDLDDLDKVSTADPADIARDDFEKKVADRSLQVNHHQTEEEGMAYLFILLDVSGSMKVCDIGGRISRAFVANVVTLALLNMAYKGNYKVWVVPFTGNVDRHGVHVATDKDTALAAMKWLGSCTYDGDSTDIEEAVRFAYAKTQEDTYRKCDIVLITDGCSPIDPSLKTDKPVNTKLRTILLMEDSHYGGHMQNLLDASDSHANVGWDRQKNIFTVGNTLKGIADAT